MKRDTPSVLSHFPTVVVRRMQTNLYCWNRATHRWCVAVVNQGPHGNITSVNDLVYPSLNYVTPLDFQCVPILHRGEIILGKMVFGLRWFHRRKVPSTKPFIDAVLDFSDAIFDENARREAEHEHDYFDEEYWRNVYGDDNFYDDDDYSDDGDGDGDGDDDRAAADCDVVDVNSDDDDGDDDDEPVSVGSELHHLLLSVQTSDAQ